MSMTVMFLHAFLFATLISVCFVFNQDLIIVWFSL